MIKLSSKENKELEAALEIQLTASKLKDFDEYAKQIYPKGYGEEYAKDTHGKELKVEKSKEVTPTEVKEVKSSLKKADKMDILVLLGYYEEDDKYVVSDEVENEIYIEEKLTEANISFKKSYDRDRHNQKIVIFEIPIEEVKEVK